MVCLTEDPLSQKLGILLLGFSFAAAPATAQRQILPGFQADPSARVFNGRIYVYPSHDVAGSTYWDMVDGHVFSSDDFVTWKDHGAIFSLREIIWAKRYAWAPDCIGRNGRYYFHFPADEQIGVAVADSPAGPFHDALGHPLIQRKEAGVFCIDPRPLTDDDGQAYLYFGGGGQLGVVKLKPDMITRDGPITLLSMPNYHEGIRVLKRTGLYHFSYPAWRGDHLANRLEYSMAPTPLGPFNHRGVILDNRSRNVHGSIVEFRGACGAYSTTSRARRPASAGCSSRRCTSIPTERFSR